MVPGVHQAKCVFDRFSVAFLHVFDEIGRRATKINPMEALRYEGFSRTTIRPAARETST